MKLLCKKRRVLSPQDFLRDVHKCQIPGVSDVVLLKDNQLVFQGTNYVIVFSPRVTQEPFLDIEFDLVFDDKFIKYDLFETIDIRGYLSCDHRLEVSPLVLSSEWPLLYALYAQAILPLIHFEATKVLRGDVEEKKIDVSAQKKVRWDKALHAIVSGLKKKYQEIEIDSSDLNYSIVWIPSMAIDSYTENVYQVGLIFGFGDYYVYNGKEHRNDANFVCVVLRFKEEDTEAEWQDLETDDNSEGGFGFLPLHLLNTGNVFTLFMANFAFVFPSFVEMIERHAC